MYKYKIKVDLQSIKRNKDVGQTTSFVPGRKTISFETSALPDYFNSDNCIITEEEINNN